MEKGSVSPSNKLAGIIFDLDGTLADTLPVCFAAFRRAFHEHAGKEYSDNEIEAMFGLNEVGLIRQVVPKDFEAALRTFLSEYESAHDLVTTPFDGIADILEMLNRAHIPTAIVTGKGDGSAEISLRRLGLTDHFKIVETGSPTARIKPQSIGKVLRKWGVAPENVAYVGDAASDISDAREAGVLALAAAWAETANLNRLKEIKPDALFESTDQFKSWIEEQLKRQA